MKRMPTFPLLAGSIIGYGQLCKVLKSKATAENQHLLVPDSLKVLVIQ